MSEFQRAILNWMQHPDDPDHQRELMSHFSYYLHQSIKAERATPSSGITIFILSLAEKQAHESLWFFLRSFHLPAREASGGFFENQTEFYNSEAKKTGLHGEEAMKQFVSFYLYWALLCLISQTKRKARIIRIIIPLLYHPIHRQLDKKFTFEIAESACTAYFSNDKGIQATAANEFLSSDQPIAYITRCVRNEALRIVGLPFKENDVHIHNRTPRLPRHHTPESRIKKNSIWAITESSSEIENELALRTYPLVLGFIGSFKSTDYSPIAVIILLWVNYRSSGHRVWASDELDHHPIFCQPELIAAFAALCTSVSPRESIRKGLTESHTPGSLREFESELQSICKQLLTQIHQSSLKDLEDLEDIDGFDLLDPEGKYEREIYPLLTLFMTASGLARMAVRGTIMPSSYASSWPSSVDGTVKELRKLVARIAAGEHPELGDLLSVIQHAVSVLKTRDDWIRCIKA